MTSSPEAKGSDTNNENQIASEHTDASASATDDENNEDFVCRNTTERPVHKLSVQLIDTYKYINKVYYEAKAKRLSEQKDQTRGGVHNDGYDDQNYDYILQGDEIVNDRYILKHKMGKGSFGQVVCAYDRENKCEVAIKIIKSRKPFLVQARTEIDILSKILEMDKNDESNVVRLLDQFIYRNHQCLVFELLSFNLYELLKNTKFRGVSLTLIRKFSRSLLKSLEMLARPDVNIIHCDLKPENILLRHPRRSAIKLIDFGSSCYLNKRTYTYIQSRFYRSPEVLLGLPYSQKIDMWSLGCVAVEMHTGEPLFGGTNQLDQMGRIVDVLGMPPLRMIEESPEKTRVKFFDKYNPMKGEHVPQGCDSSCQVLDPTDNSYYILRRGEPCKRRVLSEIIGVHTGGPHGRRAEEKVDHTVAHYEEFLDFISKMLVYDPELRYSPSDMMEHSYLIVPEEGLPTGPGAGPSGGGDATAMMSKVSLAESQSNNYNGNNAVNDQSTDGSTNSKDTVRGRRTDVASSSKRRSQSAPGVISYLK